MVEKINTGNIKLEDVRKTFPPTHPGEPTVIALEKINAEIEPGEFITLIGPSGCGKSTFLRLVAGLTEPDEGEIFLDKRIIEGPGSDRGLVFQDPTLFPWLTIEENVGFGLKISGKQKRYKENITQFIELVGLNGFETAYPHHLSGGMAQRAALARALVNHPKVLLLDEPFGALDAFTRVNMQDELLNIWKNRKTTTIMVTHDVDEAVYLSSRIFAMTPRPAQLKEIIDVDLLLGEKRDRNSEEFLEVKKQVLQILNFVHE
ncbi:ABC transporter ATP-binding protein [Enterococcus saccharolyticus]|uniref:ABC transporter domain-containing protein n=1 Tax=Enterococcus saccharolyticus subsp. saccharolyticus ATCC 43076 TaxID=1139996 RepID=S0NGF2_9ENTE|nr:ABC transporter ATP-binding protein [Enterococcus saccharolyticus]EOT29976.1 hypothetical protein OMQ_00668 [Enterococcus saccharolyticus subsp. saccharolyticus ATCC 43076]EOT80522.1 hypothetical protein I572_01049 [Enterococcus saccharolyticus subsp. saccharolyticus ATCC 43076]